MIKTLFILSGTCFSGAEIVLLEFLKRQDFLQPWILILGNDLKTEEEFNGLLGEDRVLILRKPIPQTSLGRLFLLPIQRRKYINGILKDCDTNKVFQILESIDLVYLNNTLEIIFCPPCFWQLKRNLGHVHDLIHTFKPALRFTALSSLKKINRIITVSNATKESVVKANRGKNNLSIEVIHNSIDIQNRPNLLQLNGFLNSNPLRIGFIGSFIKRKGPDLLAQASKEIANALGIQVELICLCHEIKTIFFDHVKSLIATNPNVSILLKNPLPHSKIGSFFDSVDVIVVPSRHDPLPTTILESLSFGKLVIGSNSGGIPEMLIDRDLLFDSGNPKDLAAKIINLRSLSCKNLADKITKLQVFLAESFSHEAKSLKIKEIVTKTL